MTPDDPRRHPPDPEVPNEPDSARPHTPAPGAHQPDPRPGEDVAPADAPDLRSHQPDPRPGDAPDPGSDQPDPRPGDASDPRPRQTDLRPDEGAAPVGSTVPSDSPGNDGPAAPAESGDLDELASALVDGLAGPGDTAPRREVFARAADLETARAALRDVPAVDPAARERALAAALAAFDDEAPPVSASPPLRPAAPPAPPREQPAPTRPPDDLAARRRTRPGQDGPGARRGLPNWLGAVAAAVVVLAGLVGLAAVSSDGGDDDAAMDAGAVDSQGSGDDEESATSQDASEAAPPAAGDEQHRSQSAEIEAGDLGMFATGDALVDHLRDSLDRTGADIEPEADALEIDGSAEAFAACDGAPPPPLGEPDAARVLHGRAVVDDEAVDVWVIDTTRGRRIVAMDDACELVIDRPAR